MTVPDTSEPRRTHEQGQPVSFQTDPDRGPITAAYASTLIRCLLAERPDWTFLGIAAALDQCRDEEIPKLRRAAFAVAEVPGSTPEDITRTGTHWDAAPVPPDPEPKRAEVMCAKHPYRTRASCDECRPAGKRDERFWAEFDRAKREADEERARLKEAHEQDRRRLRSLGIPEPEHMG